MHDDLISFGQRVLIAAGVPEEHALQTAQLMVKGDLDGYTSHGMSQLLNCVSRIQNGLIQVDLTRVKQGITLLRDGKATAVVDGNHYVGQIVGMQSMQLAIEKAQEHGVGIVCLQRGGHLGRLADYVEMAAENRMIGLAMASVGGQNVAAYGAMEPVAGTNPFAFAVPGRDGQHMVLDGATSAVSMRELNRRAARGEPMPSDTLLDAAGNPTTDFRSFQGPPRGVVLPFGGHKGSGLLLLTEVMAGILSGNGLGMEWREKWGSSVNAGFFQAIAVEEFQDFELFESKVDEFIKLIKSRKPAQGFNEVMFPGERARNQRGRRRQEGIPMQEEDWNLLVRCASELSIDKFPKPIG